MLASLHRRFFSAPSGHRRTISSLVERPLHSPLTPVDWSASVTTNHSSDTEPQIVLEYDGNQYVFNAGENTCRVLVQSRPDLEKMKGMFLTQVSTQRAGGLGGTLAHMRTSDRSIDIVGPPGLNHYIVAMRYFLRGTLRVNLRELRKENFGSEPVFKDGKVTVYAFPVIKETKSSTLDGVSDRRRMKVVINEHRKAVEAHRKPHVPPAPNLSPQEFRDDVLKLMFRPDQPANDQVPDQKDGDVVPDDFERRLPWWLHAPQPSYHPPAEYPRSSTLAYIVVGPSAYSHKFDYKKLLRVGVDQDPIRKLDYGKTGVGIQPLTPTNDTESKREQWKAAFSHVLEDRPAPVTIILDVPSVDFIPSVIQSFNTRPYICLRKPEKTDLQQRSVKAIFHLLGPGVLKDKRYVIFMKSFDKTQHIVSSPGLDPDTPTFSNHAYRQLQLSQLDPEVFPPPHSQIKSKADLKLLRSLPQNVHVMRPGLHVRLDCEKLPGIFSTTSSALSNTTILCNQGVPPRLASAFTAARGAIAAHPDNIRKEPWLSVKVLALGTSSASPTRYRNHCSILLQTPDGHMMLDCGDGTYGQLARRFGERTEDALRQLKCIFISHAHFDHHLGLISLLRKRRRLSEPLKQPLYVIANCSVHYFLREYQQLEDIGISEDPIGNGVIQIVNDALNYRYDEYKTKGAWAFTANLPWLDMQLSRNHGMDMCKNLNLESFETIDVFHRTRAFGAFLKHKSGWTVAYSGDTLPTANLVQVAYGTTLLIHEATLPDDEKALAFARAHTTTGQAIQIAEATRAKNLLMTHFSLCENPKLPGFIFAKSGEDTDEWVNGGVPLVVAAYDLMEMDLDKMWKANLYLRAIEQCYQNSVWAESKHLIRHLAELGPLFRTVDN